MIRDTLLWAIKQQEDIIRKSKELNAQVGDIVKLDKQLVIPEVSDDGKKILGWRSMTTPFNEVQELNEHTVYLAVSEIIRRNG